MVRQVSLIIPAYNEGKTIKSVLDKCLKLDFLKQIVAVNDGSKDDTKQILEKYKITHKKSAVEIVIAHHGVNKGKGEAIKTGLKLTKGKYVMVQDADLEYSPKDITQLLNIAETSKDGIVFGTRSYNKKKGYLLSRLGNLYLNLMFNILFGFRLTDAYTCYKLMPRKVWQRLSLKKGGFEIDSELIAKLGVYKYGIKETQISYNPRKYSEGKKIRWTDILKATRAALEVRFGLF